MSERIVYVATDGNDAEDGSEEHPKRTVKAAYDVLRESGGRIYVKAGVYDGPGESTPEGVGIYGEPWPDSTAG